MENNQLENQVENQVDFNLNLNCTENVVCSIYKEQFDLIKSLPIEERLKVLYIVISNAFDSFQNNQVENQVENQDEYRYILYKDINNISILLINLLIKTINCKIYKNWGGKRNNAGRKKSEETSDTKYSNPDNIFNPIVKEFQKQMKSVLHNAIRLSIEQANKVVELNQRIPDFKETIPIVLERLKHIQWNFDGRLVSPDVNWLLEKENYISVLNGKYTTKQQIIQEKLRQKEAENGGG